MKDGKTIVLVVDDNSTNLQYTAGMLHNEGYLVSLATGGKAALATLESFIPDIVLLDVMMPEMDGFEVCRILKSNNDLSNIPVIFLTAKDQPGDITEGFRAGGVDYLTKPFMREELLSRIKIHAELADSLRTIREFNRIRDRLYSIIAHDIRSPFATIKMSINSIATGAINPSDDQFMVLMKHLDKTVNETSAFIDNLLNYTKYQGQKVNLSLKVQDIYPVMLRSIDFVKENALRKEIKINLNIPENTCALFEDNSIMVVFLNLIGNAIKFTPRGGKIDILSVLKNGILEVHVRDNGIGMLPEVFDRVFIRNEHHFSTGTNAEKGTGLGLFIVRDLIKLNKCLMTATSNPEEGTNIIISLKTDETD